MPDYAKPLKDYAKALSANLARGDATEHTHRPALKALIETLWPDTVATNEPKRSAAGAPDYIVSTAAANVGYIEAKDIGKSLREIEKTEQLKRYLASLANLILTDYVEFRWYTDGQLRASASLGMVKDDAVKTSTESLAGVHSLLANFLQHRVPAVSSPRELAGRMARLAHMVRDVAKETFSQEGETGTLHSQYEAFKEVLLPNLSTDQFADMFAQTIAYGLFAARESKPAGEDFTRRTAGFMLPKTNPFLRTLFGHIAGPDLHDNIVWIVDDLAHLLAGSEIDEILAEFRKRTRQEDPVVHFYETFLAEYDQKMREVRGVYYTPEPVVSYIVRSVDYLLRTKFDKPLGLADPNVLILDPACGTGTFLFYAVKLIHQRLSEQGQAGGWNDYVEKHLLPRLFGFELLMAPYTIAHLKMGMLLEELGYQFKSDQRLGIYLTNTLEEAVTKGQTLGFAGFITEEANAAANVKRNEIMVVLGNPPYSGHSANASTETVLVTEETRTVGRGKNRKSVVVKLPAPKERVVKNWIGRLLDDYYQVDGKPLGEKNPKWLQDDYVKFIRFGQWRIEQTGYGILGFVTNHGYLDNPTFRGMRQSLMRSFTEISVLDLHGNTKRKEVAPDGTPDENVFDIQQGVAVGIFAKEASVPGPARVRHAEAWGQRTTGKYPYLSQSDVSSTHWTALDPHFSFYLFLPRDVGMQAEYDGGWSVADIFPVHSVNLRTHRDALVVDFEKARLSARIAVVQDVQLSDEEVRKRYSLKDTRDWSLHEAREELVQHKDYESRIRLCHYRPLDYRWIFYDDSLVEYPCYPVVGQFALPNVGFTTTRQTTTLGFTHVLATKCVTELKCVSHDRGSYSFPLYVYPPKGDHPTALLDAEEWPLSEKGRRPNTSSAFVAALKKRLGMEFVTEGKGDRQGTFGPEDVFAYIYAVFHSPTYRTRYAEFLKMDFPRVPLTSDPELFRGLVEKGEELASLHLMESPALGSLITKYPVSGSDEVEKVRYDDANRRVYINKGQYFEGVEPEVWEFHIGGYQVLDKWLKDRKGRKLTWEDQQHYQKVVVALKETMRLMAEIDALIPTWPIG